MRKLSKLIRYLSEFEKVRSLLKIDLLTGFSSCLKILTDRGFNSHIKNMKRLAFKTYPSSDLGGWIDYFYGIAIYAILRHKKPKVVVETGVGPGGTSAFILKALHDNNGGKLYSIDLPGHDAAAYPAIGKTFQVHIPAGFTAGWLVPLELRDRWELIIGDSREKLPDLMQRLGGFDIFLHDSLHTDEHIYFEFETVLPYINKDGILLCDDVTKDWSLAFERFCLDKGIDYINFNNRLGVARLVKKS